jgi:hypothetical protein
MSYFSKELSFKKDEDPSVFFKFCLKQKLYKFDAEDENSEMLDLFVEKRKYEGLSAIVVHDGQQTMGICMVEHRVNYDGSIIKTQGGIINVDNMLDKDNWLEKYNFNFLDIGVIHFYVRKKFRGIGMTRELLHKMENLQLKRLRNDHILKNSKEKTGDTFLLITSRDESEIISAKSKIFCAISCDNNHEDYNMEISRFL